MSRSGEGGVGVTEKGDRGGCRGTRRSGWVSGGEVEAPTSGRESWREEPPTASWTLRGLQRPPLPRGKTSNVTSGIVAP